ncbi:hypothetical protein [Mucilaginibacter phyllosphaerae]
MKNKKNFTLFLAIGVSIGVATHNLAIGIALGVAVGIILDARAEKQERAKSGNNFPDNAS